MGEKKAVTKRATGAKQTAKRSVTNPVSQYSLAQLRTSSSNAANVVVSEVTALAFPTVYACIINISQDIAKIPKTIMREDDEGNRMEMRKHPLWALLSLQPNPETKALTFYQTLMAHVLSYGNAFAEIERDGYGNIVALWQLQPEYMQVYRSIEGIPYVDPVTHVQTGWVIPPNGIYYQYQTRNAPVYLRPKDVLHIANLSSDGVIGYSPIRILAESIGEGIAAQQYGAQFFANNAAPSVIIQHPGSLGDPTDPTANTARDNIIASFNSMSTGRKTALLEEGMTATLMPISNADSQFLQTRTFSTREIAKAYRMPAHKINDLERATFSNISHLAIEYIQDCLLYWVELWKAEFRSKLFNNDPYVFPEWDTEFLELASTDALTRSQIETADRQNGKRSANDLRRDSNLNPYKGGDIYLLPSNMNGIDGKTGEMFNLAAQDSSKNAPDTPESPQTPSDEQSQGADQAERAKSAAVLVATDALRRMQTAEQGELSKIQGKADAKSRTIDVYRKHQDRMYGALQPVVVGLSVALGIRDADTDGYLSRSCEDYCSRRLLDQSPVDVECQAMDLIDGAYQHFMRGGK